MSYQNPNYQPGLVLQIFELGKLFTEKKMVEYRPQGTCMYPCIRPGDSLHIEPCNIREIKVGEIAVYRRNNRLFSHRTIDKGAQDDRNYIITRPDTSKFGNDGPIYEEDILGIVSSIERRGKILDTAPKNYPLIHKLFLDLYIYCYHFLENVIPIIYSLVSYLQKLKIYRSFARFFFVYTDKRISFSVQIPLSHESNSRFFRKVTPHEFLDLIKSIEPVSKWSISMNMNSKPVGDLSFSYKPETSPSNGWQLDESNIRVRYRGTDLERRLRNEANKIFVQMGITQRELTYE